VMLTCAQLGEAVGMAAAHCYKKGTTPRSLATVKEISDLQQALLSNDHHLHNVPANNSKDIAPLAKVTASSILGSPDITKSESTEELLEDKMLLFPVITDNIDQLKLLLDVRSETKLEVELYHGPENNSTFPEGLITGKTVSLKKGNSLWADLDIGFKTSHRGWHFLVIKANKEVSLHVGKANLGTAKYVIRPIDPIRPNPWSKWHTGKAAIDADGVFESTAYCFEVFPEQPVYAVENCVNSWMRPTNVPNIWVSKPTNFKEPQWVDLTWDKPQSINKVDLVFDSTLDFHFKQAWTGYNKNVIPSIVKDYKLWAYDKDGNRSLIIAVEGNYQRLCKHSFGRIKMQKLRLEILATNGVDRAQVYSVRAFT